MISFGGNKGLLEVLLIWFIRKVKELMVIYEFISFAIVWVFFNIILLNVQNNVFSFISLKYIY